jgi:diguanylate cyclase (GGDEF)-like protein
VSKFVIAFVLGAVSTTLIWWIYLRTRPGRLTTGTAGDHNAALAEISRLASTEAAVKAALTRLRTVFGVDVAVYLRRRGDYFRIEQQFGMPEGIATAMAVPHDSRWDQSLTVGHIVRPISEVFPKNSEGTASAIVSGGLNFCLPIFWGGHVYGLVLIRLDKPKHDAASVAALGSLSQILSAVSHIELMRNQPPGSRSGGEEQTSTKSEGLAARPTRQVLKLVRHRNSETVVRRLISTVQSEIGMERFVCIYEPRDRGDNLQLVAGGINHSIQVPRRPAFDTMLSRFGSEAVVEIHSPAAGGSSDELSRELARSGLRHAVSFPLSPNRRGVIAWADSKPALDIARRLTFFNDAAAELVENAESFERVEELSHTDPLTGLHNQRYLQRRLAEEINRARRYRRALGLVMIDVDLLKAVNDRFGHQAGDAILCQMGELFRRSVRDNDVIARYGGDEFCVVMPEADLSTCELFMARIRTWLATTHFVLPGEQKQLQCTISLGAAVFPDHGADAEKLIFAADMALLRAKERGRNTSQVYDRP